MSARRAKPKAQATPELVAAVNRLYRIALNFNERFVACEMAIFRLQNPPTPSADQPPASSGPFNKE
jgi:hypothetical protein